MTNRNDLFDDEPEQPGPSRASRETSGEAPPPTGGSEPPGGGDSGGGGPLNTNVSRRSFLGGAAGVAAGAAIAGGVVGAGGAVALGAFDDDDDAGGGGSSAKAASGDQVSLGAPNGRYVSEAIVKLNVNGKDEWLNVGSHESLAEVLRRTLGLTGTKIGCDRSECSACTVIVDGVAKNSCSLLAIREDGAKISTIEGQLSPTGELSPVQQAFLDKMGLQCGFCTPGQIMQATALIASTPKPDEAQIRRHMSGNLCKCSAYPHILAAVTEAANKSPGRA
jgi:aerobic-type carbon monoxide dehydrogenase small subunit (CoxS/CutS family)